MALLWWSLFVLAALGQTALCWDGDQDDYHFNCRRPGHDCNGGSCESDGNCYGCPENMTGYDCSFNKTGLQSKDCGKSCLNTNTCFQNATSGEEYCVCPSNFAFSDCSEPRVQLQCRSENSQLVFNPIGPFNGIAYLGDNPYKDSCRLEDLDRLWYSLEFDLNNDDCNRTISEDNDSTNYTSQLTIQYDPDFQSAFDLTLNVTCIQLTNGTWENTNEFTVRKKSNEKERGINIESVYFPAKLEFSYTSRADSPVSSVTLGRRLFLINRLTDTRVYKELTVDSCTISNPSGSRSVKIIENSCPTSRSEIMDLRKGVRHYGINGVYYEFNVVRFGTEPSVVVSCRVRLCQSYNNKACQLPETCNSRRKRDVDAVNRVRRDTDEPEDKEQTVSNTLRVVDFDIEEERARLLTADKCLEQPVIQSVGISLFVLLLLVFLVCLVLVFCLCRARFALRKKSLEARYMDNHRPETSARTQ